MPQTASNRNELPADRLWKIGEAAAYMRVSEQTVRNRMEDSGFPFEKIGGALRFRREDIDQWIAEQNERDAKSAEEPAA